MSTLYLKKKTTKGKSNPIFNPTNNEPKPSTYTTWEDIEPLILLAENKKNELKKMTQN